ncbi:MAG: UvrD-helicase domain-containing protein [bacterium]|nr:UvrD-helicase domain-containing protein [bacterium]MDT8396165.1 UvrD-helicase domain-containing protein [bacterium]
MGTSKDNARRLPDAMQRANIEESLDTNFLVEAAAGTGKTTSMVRRMAALIGSGKAKAANIAAVTFTRKAASELKSRFVLQLESALAEATEAGDMQRAGLLAAGIEESGRCFVGTIHSFCARLLRERPVEAGIDPEFAEMDEVQDARLRRLAFDEHMSGSLTAADQEHILKSGLAPGELFGFFETVSGHPDVKRWPAPDPEPPDLTRAFAALTDYLRHIDTLFEHLPEDHGSDTLIPAMGRLRRMVRNAGDLAAPLTMFHVFKVFDRKVTPRHKFYPEGKEQALAEAARWVEFSASWALPAVKRFMEYRYAVAVHTVLPAIVSYRRMRHLEGALNYEDLLLRAAMLLRDNPEVRRFFQSRYQRLLVDEFQDTDPVQAEVMLLLTSTDLQEKDWKRCTPGPGSLFVVGDPKQSIYRFRRADIMIYNEVRRIITGGGKGEKLELSANFRSRPELLDWVNRVFALRFPITETDEAPRYVELRSGRDFAVAPDLHGIRTLPIPATCTNKQLIMEYETQRIARTIRDLVDTGATVTGKDGHPRPCAFGDFMVVTMKREHLSPFSSALDRFSIPHQITGGSALGAVVQLNELYLVVRAAARPHDPVAMVAVLRSNLFGVADADLLDYRLAGGEFRWDRPVPRDLSRRQIDLLTDVCERLRRYAFWLSSLAPVPALERITEDLGLTGMAAAFDDGDLRAGSLYKAMEILRGAWAQRSTLDHVIETLHRLVTGEEEHDGIAARPEPASFVRVMNLHKVKGLEAPVVFLATPAGTWNTAPSLHIVRTGDPDGGEVVGYTEVVGPDLGWGRPAPVALAPGWSETWAPRETAFLEAELTRLLYVAATRAGSMLVVSHMEGMGGSHPWTAFNDYLADALPLDDPEDLEPPALLEAALGPDDDGDPSVYTGKWTVLKAKTWDKEFPSRLAARTSGVQGTPSGEHGTEWGTVIHKLLEAAGDKATADDPGTLKNLAVSFLLDAELSADHADEAVRTIQSVTASDIWAKAGSAKQVLREVPYTRLKKDKPRGPVLESGVMDLVFEEEDGWVIVDYKTGAKDLEKYRPQLEAYKEAWESFGIGRVKETGIYFVDHEEYLIL